MVEVATSVGSDAEHELADEMPAPQARLTTMPLVLTLRRGAGAAV